MKTFIALAGVVVGGVTITAATILTVWNFTAGLLMLAAAFTVLVFTAWLIRRHEDRDELAELKAAHANTIRELADTREQVGELEAELEDQRAQLAKVREIHQTLGLIKEIRDARIGELEADLAETRDLVRELKRQLAVANVKIEDLRAKEKRWLGHYDVCERAQAVAEEDERKRVSNR